MVFADYVFIALVRALQASRFSTSADNLRRHGGRRQL
jgi:hypothetical protein